MTGTPAGLSPNATALAHALAAHYRIERELGQGGMATVYLAEDLKHRRRVALKVLKPELAAVLGGDRFVQEITTTAALQHPHILPLFDSGTADGFLYYVMPYVDGETLRARLDRETQLPVDEAVRIAVAIADALDYAHRHGVIHRDIKPENILLQEGRPMVADFGIALALSAAAGGRMTETGLSLGTPHYMSPEQATAEKEITPRADIYSLASVLYEMLTGNPPHTGASAQQIIMKIVTEEAAPVTHARKSVPPHVADAVAQALEKLPADRFGTAAEFAQALGGATPARTRTVAGAAPAVAVASRRRSYAWAAAVLVLGIVAGIGWVRTAPSSGTSRQRVVLWRHAADPFTKPGALRHTAQAAISPDGSSVVYSDSVDGALRLMRKDRASADAVPIPGTEGAISVFFSPDGRWIGYVTAGGRLRKVPVQGGGSITLAEDANPVYVAGAWLEDDRVVYSALHGVKVVPAGGGTPRMTGRGEQYWSDAPVTMLAPLPGSRGFLYTSCPGNCAHNSEVYVFDFEADSGRLLATNAAGAWHSPTGHVVYSDRDAGIVAAEFDLRKLTLASAPVPVLSDVLPGSFALSASGAALYAIADDAAQRSAELVWVTRDGRVTPVDADWRGDFQYPAISPDGRSIAVSVVDDETDLWVRRADGTRQRVSEIGKVSWRPSWTPDGRSLYFASNAAGDQQTDMDVYRTRAEGGGQAERVVNHRWGLWESEVSRDGGWLVMRTDEPGNINRLYMRRLSGDTSVRMLAIDSTLSATQVALSPDGRWLAFLSPGSGRHAVYVTPFPEGGWTRVVSREFGSEPRWSRSGRELFFRSASHLMSVPIGAGAEFDAGTPRQLFPLAGFRFARNRQQYDVSPDGSRFLMIREPPAAAPTLVYVENWFEELRERMRR